MDKGGYDHVLWCGDFNFDPRRHTAFTEIVRDFLQRFNISSVWESFPCNYTHVHTDHQSTSVLDHFLCDEGLQQYNTDSGPIHLGCNLSRHSPIMLRLDVGSVTVKIPTKPTPGPKKPAWYKATEEQVSEYTVVLAEKLFELNIPASLSCRDVSCVSHNHKEDRDSYMLDVLCAMCDSGRECLPQTGGRAPANKNQPDNVEKVVPGCTIPLCYQMCQETG